MCKWGVRSLARSRRKSQTVKRFDWLADRLPLHLHKLQLQLKLKLKLKLALRGQDSSSMHAPFCAAAAALLAFLYIYFFIIFVAHPPPPATANGHKNGALQTQPNLQLPLQRLLLSTCFPISLPLFCCICFLWQPHCGTYAKAGPGHVIHTLAQTSWLTG